MYWFLLNVVDESCSSLEALPVDDGGTGLVVLLLGDPHGLEGGEGGQDGASDPDGVLPLWWSDDLDLHGVGGKGGDLLLHAVSNAGVHGGTTGQNNVGVEVLPDVDVALHDGVVGGLVDANRLKTQELGLEESLWAPEPLVADSDHLAVGKLIGLLQRCGGGSGLHLLLEVKCDIAELLLDVTDDLPFSSGGEGVAPLCQDLHEVVGEVTASKVEPEDGVGKGISFVDGDGVGDTITGVHHDSGGTAGGVEGQHSLDGDVHGRCVEGLEHDLGHLLPVGLGVEGGLSEENWVLLWGHTQLVVEGVVPDLLHIVPVDHDSVLNRILQVEDTSLGLSLLPHVGVNVTQTHNASLVAGTSNDGGEDHPVSSSQ